jgi:hypothetical protein
VAGWGALLLAAGMLAALVGARALRYGSAPSDILAVLGFLALYVLASGCSRGARCGPRRLDRLRGLEADAADSERAHGLVPGASCSSSTWWLRPGRIERAHPARAKCVASLRRGKLSEALAGLRALAPAGRPLYLVEHRLRRARSPGKGLTLAPVGPALDPAGARCELVFANDALRIHRVR